MDKKAKILIYLVAALYFASIIFLCLFPFSGGVKFPRSILGIPSDKIAHFFMFFPFPLIVRLLFNVGKRGRRSDKIVLPFILLSGFVFAFLTESAQKYLTNHRHGDWFDLLADAAGIVAGTLALLLLAKKIRKRINKR